MYISKKIARKFASTDGTTSIIPTASTLHCDADALPRRMSGSHSQIEKAIRHHLKFQTAVIKTNQPSELTMDVVVLSVDVSRSDGAPNEHKTNHMNRSNSWNSTMTESTSSTHTSSSSGESVSAEATSSLLTARHCLDQRFGCRSASRHKVEMYLHSLHRLRAQEDRLECLQEATGGEIEIVQQIADWEEQMLRLEAATQLLSRSSWSISNRRNANARLKTAVSRIHAAAQIADIPTIVQEMMDPKQGGLFSVVQELGIRSLLALTLSSQENKLHVMNCSGVAATVAAMRNHTASATLQRQGAALLLNLPFFFHKKYSADNDNNDEDTDSVCSKHNRTTNNYDRSITRLCDDSSMIKGKASPPTRTSTSTSTITTTTTRTPTSTSTITTTTTTTSCLDLRYYDISITRLCDDSSMIKGKASPPTRTSTVTTTTTSCLDLRCVRLLCQQDALRCIRTATEENLFQVVMDLSGDESDNYVRALAKEQIPALCQVLMDLYGTRTTTTASSSVPRQKSRHEQNQKVGKELSFIRRSLASLVDDPSIAPDTLASCLENKSSRRD
jgi:hypothetical protein